MKLLHDELWQSIGELALTSMLYEVSATPKPGLVDRSNCGAHLDMDFFTFMTSASSLRQFFDSAAETGWRADSASKNPLSVLHDLMKLGIAGERHMLRATHGINTHKGMIFSLGLVACAAAFAAHQNTLVPEAVVEEAAMYGRHFFSEKYGTEYSALNSGNAGEIDTSPAAVNARSARLQMRRQNPSPLTRGEEVYVRYGLLGVSGEAAAGFPSVLMIGLPAYRACREVNMSTNDALVETLLHLIAKMDDTNILGRHDLSTLRYAQRAAAQALTFGGMRTDEGKASIEALDRDFISRWISPGGSADMLAITHFLYELPHLLKQG